MNKARLIGVAVLMFLGVAASALPTFAASHAPTHPAAGYVLDDDPTPTPIPPQPDHICPHGC